MCPFVREYFSLIYFLLFLKEFNGKQLFYDRIIIFGDSNSDNGNVFKQTNRSFPGQPFFQGRFSNDILWSERLNISNRTIYAFAGATTDNNLIQSYAHFNEIPVPGVRQQIQIYQKEIQSNLNHFHRQTLFVIWAGGNNYLRQPNSNYSMIIESLMNSTKDLLNLGIENLILFNQPPLEIIPFIQNWQTKSFFQNLTKEFNENLFENIQQIKNQYKKKSIEIYDFYSLIIRILNQSQFYNLTNLNNSCIQFLLNSTKICSNPKSFLFFDDVHLTSTIHQLIANDFQKFLHSKSNQINLSFFNFYFQFLILIFFHFQFLFFI